MGECRDPERRSPLGLHMSATLACRTQVGRGVSLSQLRDSGTAKGPGIRRDDECLEVTPDSSGRSPG